MIKWIILIVLGLVILGYLGFDIRKAIEAPLTKTNLEYAKTASVNVWNGYLSKPAGYIWDASVKYIWTPVIGSITKNKNNSANLQSSPSSLPVHQEN